MGEKLKVEQRGHVLCIGLNRPEKYNAIDLDLYHGLAEAYGRLQHDRNLRCGLLYGEGHHFTSGLELDKWALAFQSGSYPELAPGACDPFGLDPQRRTGKPVVAAIQGICYTAGLELMLAADIRIAADNCRFGQIEVRRGIYPVGGATLRFTQNIGWGNSMRYLLTGDEFDAWEAFRMGLVQAVRPVGEQFDHALEIAERIARQAPLGVQATLNSARLAIRDGEKVAAQRLLPDIMPLMASEDVKEGMRSFLERREATFVGN
jgi:enoyl-CoA hydratase/carnithine racemase